MLRKDDDESELVVASHHLARTLLKGGLQEGRSCPAHSSGVPPMRLTKPVPSRGKPLSVKAWRKARGTDMGSACPFKAKPPTTSRLC